MAQPEVRPSSPRVVAAPRGRVLRHEPAPSPVTLAAFAVAGFVLVGHVVALHGLAGSEAARDGGSGPLGAWATPHLEALAGWVGRPLGRVLGLAVVVGPVLVLISTGAAALSLRESWRGHRRADAFAVASLVVAAALLALLLTRGDELWAWVLES